MQRPTGAMLMNIVRYIKTIASSPRGKNVRFRHAISLPENTFCYTYMPSQGQLQTSLAVTNDHV
jgi:hypothetical protein